MSYHQSTVRRPSRRRGSARRPPRVRRNRRVRRIPLLFWLLGVLTAEVVYLGLTHPWFNVRRIEVAQNKVLTPAQVVRRSGLRTGGNLFRARLGAARQRLLAVPAVADVSIHRRLPARIVIRVRERRPMACVIARNAKLTVDAQGVAFRVDETPPPGLPIVTGLEGAVLRPGQRIDPSLAGPLRDCVATARLARVRLSRIRIDQNGNLCFNTTGKSYEVRLGPPERLREKFALLTALERYLPELRSHCEYIDVSCLEAPAWKLPTVTVAGAGATGVLPGGSGSEGTPHGSGGLTQD